MQRKSGLAGCTAAAARCGQWPLRADSIEAYYTF